MSSSVSSLAEALEAHPRARLLSGPTPLQALPNLDRKLRGEASANTPPRLYLKRDDVGELAFGGNKLRHLEYYIGDALAKQADTLVLTGAVQSNTVRLAAAAACKLGLDCHVQLEQRLPDKQYDNAYQSSGNVILNQLLGATIHYYTDGKDEIHADRAVRRLADELRENGQTPYVIPLIPGHAPLGALGYVACALEILDDIKNHDIHIDEIVVASGSGHTHAGLLFGLRAVGNPMPVTGICVRRETSLQVPRIESHCQQIAQMLGIPNPVTTDDIVAVDHFLPPGYGSLNDMITTAMQLLARAEGVIVDPVYTGRTMAGLLHRFESTGGDKSLLAIHTGGTPGVFAYFNELRGIFS